MLWVCAHHPDLPLEVLGTSPERPGAVVETAGSRRSLLTVNAAAAARGLSAGMPFAAALHLVPELCALPRRPELERAALHAAACWAYRYGTPVCVDAGQLCVWVEVERSLSLFGGWPALRQHLEAPPDEHALPYRRQLAVAPTQACAVVLARLGAGLGRALFAPAEIRPALTRLPVAQLPLAADAVAVLKGSGLHTAGAVFALPEAALAQRFGTGAVLALRRLLGEAAETWEAFVPPARFHRRFYFAEGVETTEAVLFPLRPLLGELAAYLAARDASVQGFELRFVDARRRRSRVAIGLQSPTADPARLLRVARERLERVQVADPIVELAVCAEAFEPAQARQDDLFDATGAVGAAFRELHERLVARLGEAAVRRVAVAPEVRAERAWTLHGSPAARADAQAFAQPRRPLWLLPAPEPLAETPQLLGPPERVEQGWWDGAAQARDYFLARLGSGRLCWVYREVGERGFRVQGYWQ